MRPLSWKRCSRTQNLSKMLRGIVNLTKNLGFKGKVKIRAVSFESIHKHNAVSEIERVFN